MIQTLTGSFKMSGLDADNLPVGALMFEKDGSMRLAVLDKDDEEAVSSILMLSDFFHYALSKPDWMQEFINFTMDLAEDYTHDTHETKPHLRIIQGGLSNVSGTISKNNA